MAHEKNDTYNTFEWLKAGIERYDERSIKFENINKTLLLSYLLDAAIAQQQIDYAHTILSEYKELSMRISFSRVKEFFNLKFLK
jgi:hypothetical protein